jgi:hypothetical protein
MIDLPIAGSHKLDIRSHGLIYRWGDTIGGSAANPVDLSGLIVFQLEVNHAAEDVLFR